MLSKIVLISAFLAVGFVAAHPKFHPKGSSKIFALPAELELPVTNHYIDEDFAWSAFTANVTYKGTLRGLDQVEESVQFNCTSNQVQFSYLVPAATVEGIYYIDAGEYYGVAGNEEVIGQESYNVTATNFRLNINGRIKESSFVCVIQDMKVTVEGGIALSARREKLKVYETTYEVPRPELVTDPVKRNQIIDTVEKDAWRYLAPELFKSLEQPLNNYLSQFSLDEFINQVGSSC